MKKTFKPIIFSTEMVKAILKGRKTQTRRIIKGTDDTYFQSLVHAHSGLYTFVLNGNYSPNNEDVINKYPACNIGDILWVRETFGKTELGFVYAANVCCPKYDKPEKGWKPSIHMPKVAARIFLKVTNVRCERLQDISDEDCIAEGIEPMIIIEETQYYKIYGSKNPTVSNSYPNRSFKSLWDSINKEKDYLYNPWVWVYEFEKIEKPENFLP